MRIPGSARLAEQYLKVIGIMVVGNKLHIGGDHHMILNGDAASCHCQKIGVDKHIPSDPHGVNARTVQGGADRAAFSQVLSKQFPKNVLILSLIHISPTQGG